ncbi:MAG: aminotransferase class V-fold PLP-dependent enzyme [Devosia sp.]|uniref:cysteine desulfurase family protein n=1 Tax=Devosia sp. TaxID=1871048 RepID=UPI001A3E2C74|nr:aminotransferase class V-fold PLP-dependent enzyme [Devosia sp.]MBL8596696.1 aminotransferase class V-fold PLP-dependent enzyme [Devosia sp.]
MSAGTTYLDHNASAPLLPEAREAVLKALELTGNPSSVHAHGRALRSLVDEARTRVAKLAGATREQVVFTGSATEAITQAIVGGAKALGFEGVVISAGEHAAVSKAAEATGLPVTIAGLDENGVIRVEEIAAAMARADAFGAKLLVAVHLVNNETGVIQPIDRIEVLVGTSPHFLFVDAVQALGKLELDFAGRAPDMMAVSAHKIGGPQGVGALLLKGHADQVRLIPGGGQETGRRGGTEAAALIAGFGAAAQVFPARYFEANPGEILETAVQRLRSLAPATVVFGETAERIGNTLDFAIPGLKNSVAMMGLDLRGISVSSGSACSSGKVGPSHVLRAMGVPAELGECAMRLSVGWNSTMADIDAFIEGLTEVLNRHRERRATAA